MAINLITVALGIANPRLSGLANRTYSKKFTAVPNTALPSEVRTALSQVYYGLTGREMDLTANTLAVSANEDGLLQRLYTPKLYVNSGGNGLYIRWGDEQIPIEAADGKLASAAVAGYKVGFKFTKYNFSNRGEDPAIEVKVTLPKAKDSKDTDIYLVNFSVSAADWKAYDGGTFETALENDTQEFYSLLAPEATNEGSGRTEGVLLDDRAIKAAVFGVDQLPTRALSFRVTAYRAVKVKYGQSYILQADVAEDAEVLNRLPGTDAPFQLWANSFIRSQLDAVPAPNVSKEEPATFVIPEGRRQPYLVFKSAATSDEGDLSLDFE